MSMTDYSLTHDVGAGNRQAPTTRDTTPPPGSNPPTPAPAAATASPPTAQQQANAQNLQSATALVQTFLGGIPGLQQLDPTGVLAGWITGQMSTLAGQNLSSSDIVSTIESTMNNPTGNPQAKAIFDQLFPGYNQRIQNGYTNTDSGTGAGIAGYLAYNQQVQAMAETAGLVPGTISAADIGAAWAGDVSTSELSTRITTEYVNAHNALPQVQQELQNYGYVQGLSTGQLASYYINPANTTAQLQQQFNSAVAGGEGTLTGFGEIGKAQAQAVGAFLSNQGQNNLSTTTAAGFFTGSLGNGMASIAQMAQSGFEQAGVGTAANGPGVVNQGQLLGAAEGNAGDIQATRRAAETRAAGAAGGGGFVGANNAG